MAEALLEMRNVCKSFRTPGTGAPNQVLAGVDFAIKEGETVSLSGPSGAGKSTLVKILLGLEPWDSGAVLFLGREIKSLDRKSRQELRQTVQVVWQDPFLFLNGHMTVGQLIEEPMLIHGLTPPAERDDRVKALMESVGLGLELAGRRPHEMSGGQCQRVALARALAAGPKLLICDESLTGLDTVNQARLVRCLNDLVLTDTMALLFISHDQKASAMLCRRRMVLCGGILTEDN